MPSPVLIRSSFWEGDDPGWTLAQLIDKNGDALLEAGVSAIVLNIYDTEDRSLVYGPIAMFPAGIVFDAWIYAGTLWTEDDIGCNFAHYLPDTDAFSLVESEGGKTYRIEYDLTTTTSGNISVVHEITCKTKFTQ